ncbi:putative membrane protein [Rhodobium gokarnense]|uniref:Protoporphyrinogen IX oxidase n=2 Tax=Rhodobium gokarnense TaxID=364296 RepID=A0ABT3HE38_9HYPH|nr:protoporphyrinogen oxidase HemJ [Rhodobium gokarnense]MCW2308663.1 putative membrane protein [Rhodobium gokarnense]
MFDDLYSWQKTLHIISIIAWMAALFYLPRLYVYHTMVPVGSDQSELFKVMERKLLRMIGNPAMISSWIFGLWIAWDMDYYFDVWFILKFIFVALLTWYHMWLGKLRKAFAADANEHSERFYRMINEIPTLIMIVAVILVIFKPF